MEWIPFLIIFTTGFVLGIGAALLLRLIQSKTAKELANELYRENEYQRQQNIDIILTNLKANFGNLSLNALSKSTEEFLKLAKSRLDSEREISTQELDKKKSLIDQQLFRMTEELQGVSKLMKDLEKDRVEKFSELASHLKTTGEQTAALMQTTNTLKEALASSKIRGQWGERMAEDVLRLAGFIEKINYLKQKTITGPGSRPDFTFLLPRNLKLNMDVKFPLDNYMKFLESSSAIEKEKFQKDFLKDVKSRIREVTTREYINPEQNTVDYVLLFIPNEQIYAFIHQMDSSILDDGIRNRVIFCSPMTLFAILSVVRQAIDNFALEQTSNEILSLFGVFKKQWHEFVKRFDQLGKRIGDVQKEYDEITTTRRRQLEKPLNRIESLREQRGLPAALNEQNKMDPPIQSEDPREDMN
ncbi:DNA recombination protein RmuC [candidate division KSB1 bacterium]|nr:DNA recombination protein RmuC [candidate division KSB1 bacterium]